MGCLHRDGSKEMQGMMTTRVNKVVALFTPGAQQIKDDTELNENMFSCFTMVKVRKKSSNDEVEAIQSTKLDEERRGKKNESKRK